jgi:hypothetical protein
MPLLFAIPALFAVLIGGFARGDEHRPTLRKLCIDAPFAVLAEPVDPVTPTRFKVVLVVRGKGIRAGQELAPAGLAASDVKTFDDKDLETGKFRPRRISQALLFLSGPDELRLLPGGLRLCTEDGRVLVPTDGRVAGTKRPPLEVQPKLRWQALLARVREDVASVDQVRAYRRLGPPQRRMRALLDWIQRRRGEFVAASTPDRDDEAPGGWEDLQMAVFDWALEGTAPDDAWAVVRLYAELNRGEVLPLHTPIFSTPDGRALLAKTARDERTVLAERRRALRLLHERMTLWPTAEECRQGARPVQAKEQETLLDGLALLLPNKDELFRAEVVRTIAALSVPEGKGLPVGRTTRSLAALVATYRTSAPGTGRDELSATICALAPASQWRQLTGNPAGVCVCLRDLEREGETISFWLTRPAGAPVYEQPVLVLEKLGALGFVTQSQRLPVPVLHLEGGWGARWSGTAPLAVRMDLPGLVQGSTYRLRVEGFVGKDKERKKWTSEPKRFLLPAPKQQGRGGSSGPVMIGD